jgi:MFS transporter, DHA2 family, multidrug resistance protein
MPMTVRRESRGERDRGAVEVDQVHRFRRGSIAGFNLADETVKPDVEAQAGGTSQSPARAGLVLIALIVVAGVANLNLSVANVALPDIGAHFDSSQTTLDLIAVGYSLGLACSVLWLGALGDRYGRKLMLLLGTALAIPMSVLAALAPSDEVLFLARLGGGIAAGMAYPTTLALITALWAGPGRTKSIALWSALGGGIATLGPLLSGFLLQHFYWGSVFLITLPLAVVALVLAWWLVPAHVNESTEQVDNLGGVLSLVLVGSLILSINFAPVPNKGTLTIVLAVIAAAAVVGFYVRQRRAENPLYDLDVAARRTFWVAACAGIIVFGSLMGAAFVSQQYLQNVLGYSTLQAGAAILPAVVFMVLVAPRSAKLVEARGARFTLLCGYVFLLLAFVAMLLLWKEGTSYWEIAIAYAFVGIGVGFAGTPASHSLTSSVPVRRAGMASGTADLQRDLGGAIMQSIFGALLTAGYASAAGSLIASSGKDVTASTQAELTKSFSSAADTASRYPASMQDDIIAGAKTAFLDGDQWAYTAGVVAILVGAVLVFFCFPKKQEEDELLARYLAEDADQPTQSPSPAPAGAGAHPAG